MEQLLELLNQIRDLADAGAQAVEGAMGGGGEAPAPEGGAPAGPPPEGAPPAGA